MATNKQELLDQIKTGRLHKLYFKPNDTIPRDDIEQEVNATGEATDRLMDLQKRIKTVTMRETDWPQELRKDADDLRALVQSAIVRLYADSADGSISNAEFKEYFTPLAGMTEGLIAALSVEDPGKMMTLRSMREECRSKPFWRQLRKVVHESARVGSQDRTRFFQLAKAVNSFNTHLFIGAEQGGHLPTGLVEEVHSIVESLNEKAKRGMWDYASELAQIHKWGLVEEKTDPDVSAAGQPTGDDRWPGKKDGKGAKAEVKPPQLVQAPGNPEDEKEGEEPEQDEGDMEKGLPSEIDDKPAKPKTESVLFRVRVPKNPSFMEWNIHCGRKTVGEAWRHTFLGGSRLYATVDAAELFPVLKEDARVRGGVKVEAADIYQLQLRVVEELNKLSEHFKQPRKFRLARD